jgi:hypothetical protein
VHTTLTVKSSIGLGDPQVYHSMKVLPLCRTISEGAGVEECKGGSPYCRPPFANKCDSTSSTFSSIAQLTEYFFRLLILAGSGGFRQTSIMYLHFGGIYNHINMYTSHFQTYYLWSKLVVIGLMYCNIPRFYQILGKKFCACFVVLIEISQGFKTFWVYLKALL